MEYKSISVGQIATNCYIVWCKKSLKSIVIDPGGDFEFIIKTILQNDLKPIKILATHGHFDHVLAINELKMAFDIPFLLSVKDKITLRHMRQSCQYFCRFDPGPPPIPDEFIKQGDSITFGNEVLKVIATPGHTPGGVCFYHKKDKVLFCGDTIFAHGGIGRTDLKEGDHDLLIKSIKNKVFSLPEDTILLPGHGEESTVRKEKDNFIF
jgi:hydroxyacylglutathione hydrolase